MPILCGTDLAQPEEGLDAVVATLGGMVHDEKPFVLHVFGSERLACFGGLEQRSTAAQVRQTPHGCAS